MGAMAELKTAPTEPGTQRSDAPVIWGHATSLDRLSALMDIGVRLQPEARLIVTIDGAEPSLHRVEIDGDVLVIPLRADTSSVAKEFLSEWQPSICLWTGGQLWPTLIAHADERGIPLVLLDPDPSALSQRRRRWFSDPVRACLTRFHHVLVDSETTLAKLQKLGVPSDRLKVSSQMRGSVAPPPCPDEDVAEVSRLLAGRPIWLASHVQAEEIEAVLAAQRSALRLAHRLLLVLVLDTPADRGVLGDTLERSGLRYVDWLFGDMIEDNTQVLVLWDQEELGLWYRISPLTFIGSSLVPGAHGRSPLPAAALGSAILYGPNIRGHLGTYSSLANAGAARIVKDGETLGGAVVQLGAPDRAAAMALAGWEVVTEGAPLTDDVLMLITRLLDGGGGTNART